MVLLKHQNVIDSVWYMLNLIKTVTSILFYCCMKSADRKVDDAVDALIYKK